MCIYDFDVYVYTSKQIVWRASRIVDARTQPGYLPPAFHFANHDLLISPQEIKNEPDKKMQRAGAK